MISVIVPTLNEAQVLPNTLDALAGASGPPREILVVDGGSTDGTLALAADRGCICVRSHLSQRAAQMNAGAANARGEILIFLHADTLLPKSGLESVRLACAQPGVVGGAFARRYDSPSHWLRLTCWLAHWRNRCFGWYLGDQAIFVRRVVFDRLRGFREMDTFEDLDFSRRLRGAGRIVTLGPPVISSARRFAGKGPFRTSMADFWATLRYLRQERFRK